MGRSGSGGVSLEASGIVAGVLLVVGGWNGGLWGAFELDRVAALLGGSTGVLAKVVYILVGLAAIYQAASLKAIQKRWNVEPSMRVAAA